MTRESPPAGRLLFTGPSNVGKTKRTAEALQAWVEGHGTEGVVVLDFAPEVERDGRLLGGRLTRFLDIPEGVWYGVIDAHAPRAAASSPAEASQLAGENATRARSLLETAPTPTAAFVNDATIPFQAAGSDVTRLFEWLDPATVAVVNALESDELGRDDEISRREKRVLDRLRSWADTNRRL
ncbi:MULTISPECIES: hypothetical protein [unclassified Haladaptatus]|uniref:hypothetical protein n=1 Tax=unclassified Haladaptatus TaxID=2622732 RepID=UPI0023E80829|nr:MULTISPECIES: hypothetical protein [unclassified Haladaptatus]